MAGAPPPLHIAATDKTPQVDLLPVQGRLSIRGSSIPENADRFYLPLYARVRSYMGDASPRTTVQVHLEHFNSSTSKHLLDLFKMLEDLHATGRSKVTLEWHHAEDDLDMEEAGEDFKALLEFPVKVVAF
ncbi:MAG: DUF1987 domain-containing protein [Flavobacteriales bacterium]|jgi:hypothetical protein|nr:DUF1987 domain-containing protein [Flavobacteriales bacterium]